MTVLSFFGRGRSGRASQFSAAATAVVIFLALAASAALVGCDGQPALLPNSDTSLRKSSAMFAADAAKRHYPADAPRAGEAAARADYEPMIKQIDVVNLSDTDWEGVELWLNSKYVVFVPKMEKGMNKVINYQMLFDDDGHHFDSDNGKNPVQKLELVREGKVYSVPLQLQD